MGQTQKLKTKLSTGADTTGTQLQALMLYLMSNPEIYAKLLKEIDKATADKKLSKVCNRTAEERLNEGL